MREPETEYTLKLDPWAASSLLQKAIRRGEITLALHAAQLLHRYRGSSVFRRLINIALEDVGIADPDLLHEVVSVGTDKKLREVLGADSDLVAYLVEKLAAAPKDRSADYLYCAAIKLMTSEERVRLARMKPSGLIAYATTSRSHLFERAQAAIIGCSDDRAGRTVNWNGITEEFFEWSGEFCPPLMLEALKTVAREQGHPFTVVLPLLCGVLAKEPGAKFVELDALTEPALLGGIPLYTYDKHTAVGKKATARLALENNAVRHALEAAASAEARTDVCAMAAFYADAAPVSVRLSWRYSRALEALGRKADMTSVGCAPECLGAVIMAVTQNLDHLNDLRRGLARCVSAATTRSE